MSKHAKAKEAEAAERHERQCEHFRRLDRAAKAIKHYIDTGLGDEREALSDLLADLQHWADAQGEDFADCLDLANQNYSEEKEELAP